MRRRNLKSTSKYWKKIHLIFHQSFTKSLEEHQSLFIFIRYNKGMVQAA